MNEPETHLIPTDDPAIPTELALVASRERAVSRIFKGVVLSVAGWGTMVGVLISEFLGVGAFVQQLAYASHRRRGGQFRIFTAAQAGGGLQEDEASEAQRAARAADDRGRARADSSPR